MVCHAKAERRPNTVESTQATYLYLYAIVIKHAPIAKSALCALSPHTATPQPLELLLNCRGPSQPMTPIASAAIPLATVESLPATAEAGVDCGIAPKIQCLLNAGTLS